MDLDNYIKVLCLSDANTIKGLQWTLDRALFSGRRYRLFQGNLSQIESLSIADQRFKLGRLPKSSSSSYKH